MWFMSFGSEIHVFICMGFVLVELFDEWFYSFYNYGYLNGEDLGVLAFKCEINGECDFYWLFGASQRFRLFVLEDITIFGIMGLLLYGVNIVGSTYKLLSFWC